MKSRSRSIITSRTSKDGARRWTLIHVADDKNTGKYFVVEIDLQNDPHGGEIVRSYSYDMRHRGRFYKADRRAEAHAAMLTIRSDYNRGQVDGLPSSPFYFRATR